MIIVFLVAITSILVGFLPSANAVTSVSLQPTSFSCNTKFELQITITGLASSGNTVWIDILPGYFDSNEHSVIRFSVTDGIKAPSIGGITNTNVNGDEDGLTNSSILTTLKLFDYSLPVGTFYVKVTDQDASFVTAPFTITRISTSQSVSGTVTCAGQPVKGAVIEVVDDQNCMLCGAVTDDSGNYTVYLDEPGQYTLGAYKHGLLTKYDGAGSTSVNQVVVSSGAHMTGVDLVLFEGTYFISGQIKDVDNIHGIGGVQIEGEGQTGSGEYDSTVLTGPTGTYVLPVVNGDWELEVSGLSKKGYVGKPDALGKITVSGANVPWRNATFRRANSFIYGTIKDSHDPAQPVSGEDIVFARTVFNGQLFEAKSDANESGHYVLGVFNGGWWVGADLEDICRDDIAPPALEMVFAGYNSATTHDISVPFPVQISGKVTNKQGNALQGVIVSAFSDSCWINFRGQAITNSDGQYLIDKLSPGIYYLFAQNEAGSGCPPYKDIWWTSHGGTDICSSAEPIDTWSGDASGINFSLIPAGGISGRVIDTKGNPIKGISLVVMTDVVSDACTGTVLGTGETDSEGYYQICGIPVGPSYTVRTFNGSAAQAYIQQVYNQKGIADCSEAEPVPVLKGYVTPNINFSLMIKYRSDFDADGDVDGMDLYKKSIGEGPRIPLSEFASHFGIAQHLPNILKLIQQQP